MANYGRKFKNRDRYQKKGKDRESNGVCRKDEESVRRDRSSIEESIEGNEVTSK